MPKHLQITFDGNLSPLGGHVKVTPIDEALPHNLEGPAQLLASFLDGKPVSFPLGPEHFSEKIESHLVDKP